MRKRSRSLVSYRALLIKRLSNKGDAHAVKRIPIFQLFLHVHLGEMMGGYVGALQQHRRELPFVLNLGPTKKRNLGNWNESLGLPSRKN